MANVAERRRAAGARRAAPGGARGRAAALAVALAAALCWPLAAEAQRNLEPAPRFEEAPLPPRIDEATLSERAGREQQEPPAADNPNRARLAPLPEDRAEPVDEIVVTGEEPWRQLPDLGSDWRAQRDAELERRRYVFEFFPRDDEAPVRPRYDDPFLVNPDGLPQGEITLFRWRPGRRSNDDESSDDGGAP